SPKSGLSKRPDASPASRPGSIGKARSWTWVESANDSGIHPRPAARRGDIHLTDAPVQGNHRRIDAGAPWAALSLARARDGDARPDRLDHFLDDRQRRGSRHESLFHARAG